MHLRPGQLAGGLGLGAAAGIFGALLLGAFGGGFFSLILGFLWGGLTAEAVHRGSGGHKGGAVTGIAIGMVVLGAFVSWGASAVIGSHGLSLFSLAAAVFGAASDSAAWLARR